MIQHGVDCLDAISDENAIKSCPVQTPRFAPCHRDQSAHISGVGLQLRLCNDEQTLCLCVDLALAILHGSFDPRFPALPLLAITTQQHDAWRRISSCGFIGTSITH